MQLFHLNFVRKFVILGLFTQLTYASSGYEVEKETFNDFKALMMYFNEPLLGDAAVRDFIVKPAIEKGAAFEGADENIMSKKLAEIIGITTGNLVQDVDDATKIFGENLENGRQVMATMVHGKANIIKNAKILQNELLTKLENSTSKKKYIVLPTYWLGTGPHAIALIIEKNDNPKNTFNLIVANTGDGLGYHYATKDPNEIYPELRHLWIRFEKIPKEDIFPDNSWFMMALIALSDKDLVQEIEKEAESAMQYFYGSILNNFAKYNTLDKNEKRVLPYQRSGSCALSSLMAAFLYTSKDLSSYYKNRVIIGQKMLNQFFVKYENKSDFKALISDGFDLVSRQLMRSTSSALAHQILLYLETTFPDSFLHAGLVGAGRSKWINEKKKTAIEVIANNKLVHNLVQESVRLGLKISSFIEQCPIDLQSTNIIVHPSTKNLFELIYVAPDLKTWTADPDKDVRGLLSSAHLRPRKKNTNFAEIHNELNACKSKADSNISICVRDVFEQCKNENWWEYMSDVSSDEVMNFLDTCKNILKIYMEIESVPNSLDDLVTLAHLQIAVWKSVIEYDNKFTHAPKLNFANFKPPSVLEEVIKQIGNSVTSTSFLNWPIKTNFDAENLDKLNRLLTKYFNLSSGTEEFFGPSKFLRHTAKYISTVSVYNSIMGNSENKKAYETMWNNPGISNIITSTRSEKYKQYKEQDKIWKTGAHVTLTIFLSKLNFVATYYPHYVKLMESMMLIYKRAAKMPITLKTDYSLDQDLKNHSSISLNLEEKDSSYKHNFNFNGYCEYNTFVEDCYKIKMISAKGIDIFYKLRHSQAHSGLNDLEHITNFEAWLNYVKGASDGTIFESPYFMYLTDHLLNFPKLKLKKLSDNYGRIIDDIKELYPSDFDVKHIKEVYQALMKIIKTELNILIVKGSQLRPEVKKEIMNRAVNIAIPLVKFISRVDYDKLVSGNNASSMLSQIYILFFNFGLLKNDYSIEERQISQVNILLGLICNIKIRNSKKFLELIKGTFPENPQLKSRKTLSRIHWFVARIYYSAFQIGKSHSDDVFKVGQIYQPYVKNETNSLTVILRTVFASKYTQDPKNVTIKYDDKGDIVLIELNEASIMKKVGIQLSSGKVVENGFELVEKNTIINNDIFKAYFDDENDRKIAARGEITKIGGTILYVVSDYKIKDNKIAILCEKNNFYYPFSLECQVFRKTQNDQYLLWVQDFSGYMKKIRYNWIHGYKLYRNTRTAPKEVLIMKDDEIEPLNTIETDQLNQASIRISDLLPYTPLLDYDPEKHKDLEKHLKYFTDTDTLLAKTSTDGLVVIYPGLRFYECPKFPIVLVEDSATNLNSIFEVKNIPGFTIDQEQVAIHNVGIAGTLVARNKDDQKFILAPLSEVKNDSREDLIFVERIPIVDKMPSPQTRLQKLLLAFYCIKSREYSFARELLHPFTSIDHNEPFGRMELEVIQWIVRLKGGGPEAEALKLIAYMHSFNNSRKFPTDYIKAKAQDNTEAGKTKSFRFATISSIQGSLGKIIPEYFGSIRDLPEKYYLHRIFAEYTNAENSEIIKNCINNSIKNMPKDVVYYSISVSGHQHADPCSQLTFEFARITRHTVANALGCLSKDPKTLDGYVKHMSKLIYRANSNNASTLSENEAVIVCMGLDRTKFLTAAILLQNYLDEYAAYDTLPQKEKFKYNFKNHISDVQNELERVVKICKQNNKHVFSRYNTTSGSEFTDKQRIFENLKKDMKESIEGLTELPSSFKFEPVTGKDLSQFKNIMDALNNVLKSERKDHLVNIGFNDDNIKKSPVLQKLKGSIDTFVKEKGQYDLTELDLSKEADLLTKFDSFDKYLETRINELNNQSTNLVTELTNLLNTNTAANTIESVKRLMHNRKSKNFENLYSCYQRLSVTCIQKKFPRLEENKLEIVLTESMKYYSTHVLILFMGTIRTSVKGFYDWSKSGNKITIDDLTLFLDEAGKIMDFNSRLRTPSILNFEYRSKKYRLRAEQVKDIDDLTSIDPITKLFKSTVIQRMMAAGKTLVLGTISVVRKALDNTKLSILVPPASLYQSNLSAMQARTYDFFKTRGHNFIFPRLEFGDLQEISDIVIPFLKFILQKIDNVKQARDYYVLSPETLQAFLNSYIEMINYHTTMINTSNYSNSTVIEALELYAKIYNIFRTEGSIILDEIDMTMDPKKELNFPTVENEPFNMIAATLLTDLIEFSTFDKEVIKLGLDILGNNQSALTAENYEKYRDVLFEYISDQLKVETSLWSENLLNQNVKELNADQIMSFLKTEDIEFMKDWMENIHLADNVIVGNALIIIKVQLWKYLKDAMKSTANLNFGATGPNRPDAEYAIPYLAANTPSPSSEFSDRWETLNKTLLMLASVNCTERIAKKMIGYVRSRIVEETSLKVKMNATATYKNITALIPGVDPLALNDKDSVDIKTVHDALKTRSPAAIRLLFSYALDEIFSQMKFPVEQITSNALNMVSMFGSVQGYSGTIDNVNILPREVVDGAYTNHIENEKNNGGISLKLIKDSREVSGKNKAVYQIPDEILKKDVKTIVKDMFEYGLPNKSEIDELSALIDTGAFFKNSKNKEVAEAILEISYPRISVVLYYDENSNQVEYIKRTTSGSIEIGFLSSTDPDTIFKATQTKIENRFTFYDQRHITGSDILQPKTARALMTIGTRVLLRDILQGTLRMRQFMTSQKVHLITSSSAVNFYFSIAGGVRKDHVEVSDMISLGAFNEDDKQLVENEKLAFTKIDNEVRRFVLDEITRAILESENFDKIIPLWFKLGKDGTKNIRDLFIRLIKENPLGWMVKVTKKDTGTVLKRYAEFWTSKIQKTSEDVALFDPKFDISDSSTKSAKNLSNLKDAFSAMTTIVRDDKDPKTKHLLPGALKPEISDRVLGQDGGGEVEMQVFTQQLAELDLDKLVMTLWYYPNPYPRSKFELDPMANNANDAAEFGVIDKFAVNLQDVLYDKLFPTQHLKLASSALITTGKRLAVSKDLIQIVEIYPQRPYKIFSEYTWEGSHILLQVIPGKKGLRAALLSVESAAEVRDAINSKNTDFKGSTFWLCDLSGSVSATNDSNTTIYMNVLEFMPSSRLLFFDLLVFNGSFNHILTNKHMKTIYLTRWLKHDNYRYRATFLLLRMRVLADKAKHIMANDSMEMTILNRAARGDKEILNGIKLSSGVFKKSPIDEDVEKTYFILTGKSRPALNGAGGKTDTDFNTIYASITQQSVPIPSHANELTVTPFVANDPFNEDLDTCSISTDDKVDFLDEGTKLNESVKEWLDVNDDKTDFNNYVAEPVIDNVPKPPSGTGSPILAAIFGSDSEESNIAGFVILVVIVTFGFAGLGYYVYVKKKENEDLVQISPETADFSKNGDEEEGGDNQYRPDPNYHQTQTKGYEDPNAGSYQDPNTQQYSQEPAQNNFTQSYSQPYNNYEGYAQADYQNYNQGYQDYPQVYQQDYPQSYQKGYSQEYQQQEYSSQPQKYQQQAYSSSQPQEYQQKAYFPQPQESIYSSEVASTSTATPPSYHDVIKSPPGHIEKDLENFKN